MTNPIAAANQIASEKTTETISYPITGDREVDTITAICSLLWTTQTRSVLSEEAMLRVLEYVRSRVEQRLNERRARENLWQGLSGIGAAFHSVPLGGPSVGSGFPYADPVEEARQKQAAWIKAQLRGLQNAAPGSPHHPQTPGSPPEKPQA